MKISELSARTEVPVGTVKYYLREGLLAPGRQTSRTTAEYDESHAERISLVRALTDAGGLGIATVRRIVEVLDAPEPARLDLLAAAQDALLHQEALCVGAPAREGAREDRPGAEEPAGTGLCDRSGEERGPASAAESGECTRAAVEPARGGGASRVESGPASRAGDWVRRRGWMAVPDDLLVARLERVWRACERAGVDLDEQLLDRYAEAMEPVAQLDVAYVPTDAEGAMRRVVVGTVMLEPVLLTLRMMAQRELSIRES